jgi:hypothetical protein
MFNNSAVGKIPPIAVFAENFPDASSRQMAHILVYTLT